MENKKTCFQNHIEIDFCLLEFQKKLEDGPIKSPSKSSLQKYVYKMFHT